MDVAGNQGRGFFQLEIPKTESAYLMRQSFSCLSLGVFRERLNRTKGFISTLLGQLVKFLDSFQFCDYLILSISNSHLVFSGYKKKKKVKERNRDKISCVCMCVQSCLTLCEPMDCSPSGPSVHGISQEKY